MSNLKNNHGRDQCEQCKRCFVPSKFGEALCSICLGDAIKKEILSRDQGGRKCQCEYCDQYFFTGSYNKKSYCSTFCRSHAQRGFKKKETTKTEIQKANEKWLNENPKEKRKGKSLEQLNKESEYRRVFDDKGWDHYLKGRKYDKI